MNIKRTVTFCSANVERFSPSLPESTPKAINVEISFEEALKLHLGLTQLLGKLNEYNRATTEGKRMAVNLCIYTQKQRIVLLEGKHKKPGKNKEPKSDEQEV